MIRSALGMTLFLIAAPLPALAQTDFQREQADRAEQELQQGEEQDRLYNLQQQLWDAEREAEDARQQQEWQAEQDAQQRQQDYEHQHRFDTEAPLQYRQLYPNIYGSPEDNDR
jgi:Ni/Co efflux regulator RcnB